MNQNLVTQNDLGLNYDPRQFSYCARLSKPSGSGRSLEEPEVKFLEEVAYRPVEWIWKGRIPCNKLTLIEGPAEQNAAPGSKFTDAVLALLGLLLAFTFSMSLGRHEQRRQMVVTDSNAIGDFYTTAGLLKEPVRGKLQAVIRPYVEHRLTIPQGPSHEAVLQQRIIEAQRMHHEMEVLVKEAVDGGTPVVVPLVNTLNAVTSSHSSRLAAFRDRVPPSVVLLLVLAGVIVMALMGWQWRTANDRHPGAMIGFTALVSMVLWVTLDLNQPQRGWITVSQEPLQQLLKEMEPTP